MRTTLARVFMAGAESYRRIKHGEPVALRSQLRVLATEMLRASVVGGPKWMAERIVITPEKARPSFRWQGRE